MSVKTELELINSRIDSISSLKFSPKITVLNLHHNRISEINGLTKATMLRYLDLSSNYITKIHGLDSLQHLRILNLSSNKIRAIDSLEKLNCLVRLDVSFNEITSLVGLKKLSGPSYSLTVIILQGNQINSKSHILECSKNLVNLRQLILHNPQTGDSNPVCNEPDYRLDLLRGLPQLEILDHIDRMGHSTQIDVLADLPELNEFLDMIPISDLSGSDYLHDRKDKKPDYNQDEMNLSKNSNNEEIKNINSVTSEQNEQHIPALPSTTELRLLNLESQLNSLISSHLLRTCQTEHHPTSHHHHHNNNAALQPSIEENTKKLSDTLPIRNEINSSGMNDTLENLHNDSCQCMSEKEMCNEKLQTEANPQPNDLMVQSTIAIDQHEALKVTEELKQAFTTEHQEKLLVQSQLKIIEQKFNDICQVVDHLRVQEDSEKQRYEQEIKNLNKLLNEIRTEHKNALLRAEKAEQKLNKTEKLLRNREMEYEHELNNRYKLDSSVLTKFISAKIDLEQAHYQKDIDLLQAKLIDSTKRYTALENEFRMALKIEAERYETLLKTSELCKNELINAQLQLKEMKEREESARCLIQELNTMVNEQKSKLTNQQKAHLLLQHNLKERIATLEMHLEEAQTRIRNHENLRKELKQQKAEMTAQESIIAGLKAERRNWSEELAKQGSALAQDRGRLEAKIEAQELEIASLKKSLENETDSVKIKNKIIDDQTETISDLKKCIQGNQAEIKRLQNENTQNHHSLDSQLKEKIQENTEMHDEIKHLIKRKEDLKLLVTELQSKIDELQTQNDSMTQRWRDRASLIDKLEKQVEQMRCNWDKERQHLIDERDTARKEINELHSQMQMIDERYRQQLSATEEMKDLTVNRVKNEAEQLRIACETRVAEVESEMRAVLLEAENSRKATQERLRCISTALCAPILLNDKIHCFNTPN
ncbi:unnamed protein product [Schistosoma turkestanicum]|nr:unnamed protein product [Schistosoma turkestanicum]